ncbi:uncharacterized protein LOC112545836 isoform X1 [Pelodiscus sinensis]|uniref:uncharacterized protein LOC112545836 isoform X1 n=1 Tax=Pelodiscus sinensis TaxID=13735 RepID=UPI003F6A8035
MLMEGRPVKALVDSGSSVTLIRADLVSQSQPEGEPIWMRCVHGDVRAYPTAQVHLTCGGQDLLWKVGKAKDLPYPLLIGRDWPGFGALLQSRTPLTPQGRAVESRSQGKDRELHGGAICLEVGMEPDFLTEQRMDPSLQNAWDQATATGGTEPSPDRPAQGPQFQLLYGRQTRGILDLLKEGWEQAPTTGCGTVQYITQLREKLSRLGEYARLNLEESQRCQTRYYDAQARQRNFQQGDQVMLLLPTTQSKLLAQWQGPFEIVRRVGDVDYEEAGKGHSSSTLTC